MYCVAYCAATAEVEELITAHELRTERTPIEDDVPAAAEASDNLDLLLQAAAGGDSSELPIDVAEAAELPHAGGNSAEDVLADAAARVAAAKAAANNSESKSSSSSSSSSSHSSESDSKSESHSSHASDSDSEKEEEEEEPRASKVPLSRHRGKLPVSITSTIFLLVWLISIT